MAQQAIVLSKLRAALVAFIGAANVGTPNVYDAKQSGDRLVPCVICAATKCSEEPADTGNFWCDAEINVVYRGAPDADGTDPKAAAELLASNVFTALETDDLAAQLSAAGADFTCIGVGDEKGFEEGEEGDLWIETMKLRLYCCASDL